MATATIKPRTTIHQIARQAFTEAKGDEASAKQRWLARVRQEPALVAEALAYTAEVMIGTQVSSQRTAIIRSAHVNEDRGIKDNGLASRAQSNLMAFPLPESRVPLGQATKAQVHEAYSYYRTSRVTAGSRERWCALIWQALKDDKLPVRRQLSESDLRNMEARAQKDEAAR